MPTLDYAPPTPWYRRKRFRHRILAILAIALLTAAASQFGPGRHRRALLLYWQHQCMIYADPPGTLASDLPTAVAGRPLPAVWENFNARASYTSTRWFYSSIGQWGIDEHIIFLHGRTSSAGQRLVFMRVYSDTRNRDAKISGMVIAPFGLLSDPANPIQGTADLWLHWHASDTLRIYTGQPDPTDPASLTIDFDLNAARHTARFTLTPAGDYLTLTSVTPPLPTR